MFSFIIALFSRNHNEEVWFPVDPEIFMDNMEEIETSDLLDMSVFE